MKSKLTEIEWTLVANKEPSSNVMEPTLAVTCAAPALVIKVVALALVIEHAVPMRAVTHASFA